MDVLGRSLLSSVAVCRQAGVTYRQLDYWVRSGVLEPALEAHGSGTQRRFSETDSLIVWVLGRLAARGARRATLAAAARAIAAAPPMGPSVLVVDHQSRARLLGAADIDAMDPPALVRALCGGWALRLLGPLDDEELAG